MTHYLNVFFYDIYPYICATVFFLGSWLRYDYGYTGALVEPDAQQARYELGSNLFHIGILVFRAFVRHVNPALDVRLVLPVALSSSWR
ncbi:MAG: respiratory nitrate reductase subunit gamma [Enterobacter hormaechei]